MTNTLELDIAIRRAGLSRLEVAKAIGITLTAFFNKLHNKTDFKAREIATMRQVLELSDKQVGVIFFNDCVD